VILFCLCAAGSADVLVKSFVPHRDNRGKVISERENKTTVVLVNWAAGYGPNLVDKCGEKLPSGV
jgi:hypothetical protein